MSLIGETMVEIVSSVHRYSVEELCRDYEHRDALPYIATYSLHSGRVVLEGVARVWAAGQSCSFVEIETLSGIKVRCTTDHPFLLGKSKLLGEPHFVHADKLSVGDIIQAIDNSERTTMLDRVEKVTRIYTTTPVKVYDMEIYDHHTFAISNADTPSPIALVVHNHTC